MLIDGPIPVRMHCAQRRIQAVAPIPGSVCKSYAHYASRTHVSLSALRTDRFTTSPVVILFSVCVELVPRNTSRRCALKQQLLAGVAQCVAIEKALRVLNRIVIQ